MGAAGGQDGGVTVKLGEVAPGVGSGELARAGAAAATAATGGGGVGAYDGLPFGGVKI